MADYPSAPEWFGLGKRVAYDRRTKRILQLARGAGSPDVVHVFRRIESEQMRTFWFRRALT